MIDFYGDDLTLEMIQTKGGTQVMVFRNRTGDCDETVSIGVDGKELLNIYEKVRMRCETIGLKKEELRTQVNMESNSPSTQEELREMAQHGLAVWCVDTDGIAQGLLFMHESWDDSRISPHICLIDEEGDPGVYHVEYMAELGAKFYRQRPEEVKAP